MISELGTHVMILEKTHPTGTEEWHCPTCGRRMLLQWPPAFQWIVLEPGDQYAQHSGSKGGLRIGVVQATEALDAGTETSIEDDEVSEESLRLWLDALDEIEFDGLGDEKAA